MNPYQSPQGESLSEPARRAKWHEAMFPICFFGGISIGVMLALMGGYEAHYGRWMPGESPGVLLEFCCGIVSTVISGVLCNHHSYNATKANLEERIRQIREDTE